MCVKGVASVQARLVSFRHAHVDLHAVLRHAAVGIGLCISLLLLVYRVGTFEGLCARGFWLKALLALKVGFTIQ